MKVRLHSFPLAAAVILTGTQMFGQGADTQKYPPVTAKAVWDAGAQAIQKARAACANQSYPALGACFAEQMKRAGATPEALAFMKRLHDEAYLAKFQDTGRVSIAWVVYPYRANTNTGCLLVNGTPALVDVDDTPALETKSMKSSPEWQKLVAKHPGATLWPADRSGMTGVQETKKEGGGQEFTVEYLALNGCHACARLAQIRYAFDFDLDGRFLGTRFIDLKPMP